MSVLSGILDQVNIKECSLLKKGFYLCTYSISKKLLLNDYFQALNVVSGNKRSSEGVNSCTIWGPLRGIKTIKS